MCIPRVIAARCSKYQRDFQRDPQLGRRMTYILLAALYKVKGIPVQAGKLGGKPLPPRKLSNNLVCNSCGNSRMNLSHRIVTCPYPTVPSPTCFLFMIILRSFGEA